MIYCVEDDKNICDLVVYALRSGGYEAEGFGDAESFYRAVSRRLPKLVLLDVMLPREDGVTVLKKLKGNEATKLIPVIMLTAKTSEYDKVQGLDLGADDYITKPFGVMELQSRIKAVLRRVGDINGSAEVTCGQITVNPEKFTVSVCGSEVTLTHKEFLLLHYLITNRGIVLTREKLLSKIWGYDYEGETRTVDVHIGSLRQKLGAAGESIQTVRGVGYRIGG